MRKCFVILITCIFVLGVSLTATQAFAEETKVAQAQKAKVKKRKKTKVVYEKETVMSFDDSVVEGRALKPDGFFLLRKRPKRWQDLIKVREDFNAELKTMKFEL